MNPNKIDKNMIGNFLLILSIILIVALISVNLSITTDMSNTVKWNGKNRTLPSDAVYNMTEDSLIIHSAYSDINLTKTNDLTKYNENILSDDIYSVLSSPYNSTHTHIWNEATGYNAIVPNNSTELDSNDNLYKIDGNPEIIEVIGSNPSNTVSWLWSSEVY